MPRYVGAVLYKYKAKFNNQIYTDYTTIRIDITCPYNKLQTNINKLVRERQQALEEDYNIDFVEGTATRQQIYNERTRQQRNIRLIRMRDPIAPQIDTFPNQSWDTHKGTCVIDYLFSRYQLKRKIPTKDHLINILQKDDEEDIVKNGVSTKNIENFANYINIPVYVLNDFDDIEYEFIPSTYVSKNANYPSLVYRVSNQHFYPIEDPSLKKHYIIKKLERQKSTNRLLVEPDEERVIDLTKIHYIDNVEEHLLKTYKEQNILPNKIQMVDNNIISYTLNDITYKHQPYHQQIEQACISLNIPYKSQNMTTFIMEYLKKTLSQLNPISSHNSEILNQLIKAKENRIHHGYIDEYNHIGQDNNLVAWDINKAYRSVIYEPLEKWIVLDWTDDWKPIGRVRPTEDWKPYQPKNTVPLGLYYVQTDDTTLFKKSNIYSSAIINYAKKTNIQFKITKQLVPSHQYPKSTFKEYIEGIITTLGETSFSKELINYLTGMMGKHSDNKYHVKLNTDIDQILDYVNKQQNKVIVNDLNDDETNPLYVYGCKYQNIRNETYLPIYIQIIDQSNIKLHQMLRQITKIGHTPIYRKTDCIIFKPNNKQIYPIYDDTKSKWGQYRKTDVPRLTNTLTKTPMKLPNANWKIHPITNSNQITELYNIIKEQSVVITGQAGTGKSYIVNEMINKYLNKDRILITSFTNRCALNWINGQTLHSAVKITAHGKIAMKQDNFRKFCKSYDYIVIDEISMIPKHIWKIISYIKDNSNIKFILIGDHNQTKPIEFFTFNNTHYMNNSGVKYIADYNKVNLKEIQRYDKELHKILENLTKYNIPINIARFPEKQNTTINLSFLNKTRLRINELNNKKEGLFVPKNPMSKQSQDMYIYEDCPVIAYKTDKNKAYVNSEIFTVSHYDKEYIYLYSLRNNDIHAIDIPISEFNNIFLLGYCMTVHKSQGSTIKQSFNIYDWKKMDKELRYTALSRAKSINQIGIIP